MLRPMANTKKEAAKNTQKKSASSSSKKSASSKSSSRSRSNNHQSSKGRNEDKGVVVETWEAVVDTSSNLAQGAKNALNMDGNRKDR